MLSDTVASEAVMPEGTLSDVDTLASASDICVVEPPNGGPDAEVAAAAERLNCRWGYRFVKRLSDIVFSLLVLVLFSWLFAVVAIAIKIDDPKGPVVFKQRRVTKNGREFKMYKFRSMCVDAEAKLEELRKANVEWEGKQDFLLRTLKRIAARIPLETCSPRWNACAPYSNRALCT